MLVPHFLQGRYYAVMRGDVAVKATYGGWIDGKIKSPWVSMSLKNLVCIRRNIFGYILNAAVENPAEIIKGGGIQGFIFSQFIYGCTGYVMLSNKRVCRLRGFVQGFPEWTILNHDVTPIRFMISEYGMAIILTIVRKETIIK